MSTRLNDVFRKLREWYQLGGGELVRKKVATVSRELLGLEKRGLPVTIELNGKMYRVIEGPYPWRRFARGSLMPEVTRPMDEVLGSSDVFLDVGAGFGDTAFYAHSLVGDAGEVHAFEPNLVHFDHLEKNIEANELENVHPYDWAVGDEEGMSETKAIVGGEDHRLEGQTSPVRTIRLDEFVERQNIEPDLIKIDVDGLERKVLEGCGDALLGSCPIILELHPAVLEDRGSSINMIFDFTDEVKFLGVPTIMRSPYMYGDIISGDEEFPRDAVTLLGEPENNDGTVNVLI